MSNEITNFAMRKSSIARCLYEGQCGGSYPEAILILSSAISGIASLLWTGIGIDRKRFVELLCIYSTPDLKASFLSIPLLAGHLQQIGNEVMAKRLETKFLPRSDSLVVISNEVDHSEQEVREVCPELTLRELRKFSYANLLYTELRSGFVHEYELKNLASPNPMTQRDTDVSYVNTLSGRLIYFHFEYLFRLLNCVAISTQPLIDIMPIQYPQSWWIEC